VDFALVTANNLEVAVQNGIVARNLLTVGPTR